MADAPARVSSLSEAPLVLEDLPDDLLRRCVRSGAPAEPLGVQDVLSLGMCNKNLRRLVQGGGVLREFRVTLSPNLLLPLDLPRRLLSGPRSLKIGTNIASLDWLCSWGALQGEPPEKAELVLRYLERVPPETRARLGAVRGLSPTFAKFNVEFDRARFLTYPPTSPQFDEEDVKRFMDYAFGPPPPAYAAIVKEAVDALEGCPRLTSADVAVHSSQFGQLTRLTALRRLSLGFTDSDLQSAMNSLMPLANLRELQITILHSTPITSRPAVAVLTALTALTLPLGLPSDFIGPLPPALESLTLKLHNLDLNMMLEEAPSVVRLDLKSPKLRETLSAAAAASVRRLTIHCIDEYDGVSVNFRSCVLRLALTVCSIPCAFYGLEEFIFTVDKTARPNPLHSADLVALLEAAPGLRRVTLSGVQNLSEPTQQWLAAHRPGHCLGGGEGDTMLELL
jgi:hypothetical protein